MTESGFLNAEQLKDNERKKERLGELIGSGESFLMVGAGSSKLLGYPLWGELLTHFEKNISRWKLPFDPRQEGESDLTFASRIKQCLGEKYYTVINDLYGADKGFDPCHAALVKLPFKGILTTNYDPVLEKAVKRNFPMADPIDLIIDNSVSKREVYKFLRSLSSKEAKPRQIVHLHGEYRHPSSIILCAEEYEEKYGIKIAKGASDKVSFTDVRWTLHRKLIWSLMATRRLVYVGFSMTDIYFRIMHALVSEDIASYDSDVHFLVARITPGDNLQEKLEHAEWLKMHLGIETVIFEDDDSCQGFSRFVFQLEASVTGLTDVVIATPATPPASAGNKIITNRLFDLSLKQVNDGH